MKKILSVITAVVFALVLVACGPSEVTATGYGITHEDYVGAVTLTVSKDGVVLSGSIEEYYLPFTASVLDAEPTETTDYITGVSHGSTKFFAQYFSVNGLLFIGTSSDSGLPTFATAAGVDILTWVADEANAKAYVEGALAGTVFIANADGSESTAYTSPVGDEWTKSATGYGGTTFDWQGQMDAIVAALVGTTVDDTYVQNDDSYWVVGDVVSGATLTSFAEYYAVAQRAYADAMAEF